MSNINDKQGMGTIAIHAGEGPYAGALSTRPVVNPIHMGSMFEL